MTRPAWCRPSDAITACHRLLSPPFAGQWASTRPDLFPPDFCEALCRLHDGVGSHPLADARQLIEAELGAPLGQLFCVLNPLPLGTGSIAQVYEAVLCPPGAATEASCQLRPPTRAEVATAREEGRHVAVKVQHPGVRGRITQDLRLMHRAVAVVSLAAPSTHWFALREVRMERGQQAFGGREPAAGGHGGERDRAIAFQTLTPASLRPVPWR